MSRRESPGRSTQSPSSNLERWLAGATTNPNEASKKAKLKMMLVQQ